jgi:hypothetical protein
MSQNVTLHLCISRSKHSIILSEYQSNTVRSHTVQLFHEPQFLILLYSTLTVRIPVVSPRCSTIHSAVYLFHEAQFLYSSCLHQQFESCVSKLSSEDENKTPQMFKSNLKYDLSNHIPDAITAGRTLVASPSANGTAASSSSVNWY